MLDAKDLPETSGIYLIWCNANGKPYVGQAKNIRKRVKRHISELTLGKHGNDKFQSIFNKYGIESFDVFVVYECAECELTLAEQEWIDFIRLDLSYAEYINKAPIAESSRGVKWSDESRKKASESHTGKKLSPEHIERARQGLIGKKHTPERVEKVRESNRKAYADKAKEYSLISPDGIVYIGKGIKRFAREHGLSQNAIKLIMEEKKDFYNGWRKWPLVTNRIQREKTATFRSPEGELITVTGISKFAKSLGLDNSGFSMLYNRKIKSYHKWTLVSRADEKEDKAA